MTPRSAPPAVVLFDIDGTLLRKAGPHHRQVLVEAVRLVTGRNTSLDHIPVQGMLDRDILGLMMSDAGIAEEQIRQHLPAIVDRAQSLYESCCPDLRTKVCPGARLLLKRLKRAGVPCGLVTGNLSRIAWKKMRRAALLPYFSFGAFSEQGHTRAELAKIALATAGERGWLSPGSRRWLVGDHENDIRAAKANGIGSVAVTTGLSPAGALAACEPDILVEDLADVPLASLLNG